LRTTFSRLARNGITPEYLTFLARAYELKSIADYSVGPAARPITADDAARAIETAERFIDTITQLLRPGLAAPRSSAAQP
jgi:HEPN domain-containing protein